ncbi:hypothetical protein NP493_382g00022 [Ridgeia piscesae]|uniref:Craniofacial development protein 2-like n=1 Tax=Ridgeia piscesae TaxID=27915 RepID=A0AAD9L204_RIDPI|nr:hypothetical protein NP493_382g00022 [Ridgeia piscesae]
MTTPAESLHQEGRCATDSLLGPKTKISIGTWNVRTMKEASTLAQVIREMKRYRLDILGVSECRWTGSGRQVSHDGSTILYSGHTHPWCSPCNLQTEGQHLAGMGTDQR